MPISDSESGSRRVKNESSEAVRRLLEVRKEFLFIDKELKVCREKKDKAEKAIELLNPKLEYITGHINILVLSNTKLGLVDMLEQLQGEKTSLVGKLSERKTELEAAEKAISDLTEKRSLLVSNTDISALSDRKKVEELCDACDSLSPKQKAKLMEALEQLDTKKNLDVQLCARKAEKCSLIDSITGRILELNAELEKPQEAGVLNQLKKDLDKVQKDREAYEGLLKGSWEQYDKYRNERLAHQSAAVYKQDDLVSEFWDGTRVGPQQLALGWPASDVLAIEGVGREASSGGALTDVNVGLKVIVNRLRRLRMTGALNDLGRDRKLWEKNSAMEECAIAVSHYDEHGDGVKSEVRKEVIQFVEGEISALNECEIKMKESHRDLLSKQDERDRLVEENEAYEGELGVLGNELADCRRKIRLLQDQQLVILQSPSELEGPALEVVGRKRLEPGKIAAYGKAAQAYKERQREFHELTEKAKSINQKLQSLENAISEYQEELEICAAASADDTYDMVAEEQIRDLAIKLNGLLEQSDAKREALVEMAPLLKGALERSYAGEVEMWRARDAMMGKKAEVDDVPYSQTMTSEEIVGETDSGYVSRGGSKVLYGSESSGSSMASLAESPSAEVTAERVESPSKMLAAESSGIKSDLATKIELLSVSSRVDDINSVENATGLDCIDGRLEVDSPTSSNAAQKVPLEKLLSDLRLRREKTSELSRQTSSLFEGVKAYEQVAGTILSQAYGEIEDAKHRYSQEEAASKVAVVLPVHSQRREADLRQQGSVGKLLAHPRSAGHLTSNQSFSYAAPSSQPPSIGMRHSKSSESIAKQAKDKGQTTAKAGAYAIPPMAPMEFDGETLTFDLDDNKAHIGGKTYNICPPPSDVPFDHTKFTPKYPPAKGPHTPHSVTFAGTPFTLVLAQGRNKGDTRPTAPSEASESKRPSSLSRQGASSSAGQQTKPVPEVSPKVSECKATALDPARGRDGRANK